MKTAIMLNKENYIKLEKKVEYNFEKYTGKSEFPCLKFHGSTIFYFTNKKKFIEILKENGFKKIYDWNEKLNLIDPKKCYWE